MMKPRVKVLYAPGINCHHETVEAFRLAGGDPKLCNLTSDLIAGREKMTDCDILAIPGGFSFGDHIAGGRIFALDLIYRLRDQLLEIREKQIPTIGICNGFQILINCGLLPGNGEIGESAVILDRNQSAVFESRWVDVTMQNTDCFWTRGLESQRLTIPVAHGEGRLRFPGGLNEKQVVLRYGPEEGTETYPANPNGTPGGIAGICDPSGLIMGLMPHPERAVYPWLGNDSGIRIFQVGVKGVG